MQRLLDLLPHLWYGTAEGLIFDLLVTAQVMNEFLFTIIAQNLQNTLLIVFVLAHR